MTEQKSMNPHNICMWKDSSECEGCELKGKLKCRFQKKDLLIFILSFLIFFVPAVIGVIRAGYGWFLIGWFVFFLIFFEFWEIRIICSHCPFYAEEGRILHCIANYGIFKVWKYHPEPISLSEKIQIFIGFIIFGGYPIVFLILGAQYLFLIIYSIGLAFFFIRLQLKTCPKCVNFSCPLNRVPKNIVDAYLKRNPVMKKAWEEKGYKID